MTCITVQRRWPGGIGFLLCCILCGCVPAPPGPAEVYLRYNQAVIDGLSFQQEHTFFSVHKQELVENSLQAMMQQMQKDRDSVIAVYMAFAKSVAKCRQLNLLSEEIHGRFAIVIFSQKEICGSELTGDEKQIIHLIKEDGWKIDDIEIQI